ncbi:Receptor-like protein kinase [Nymphaea thermarum]|nr:Receptor-like protein kinase [Nymphaea thermarum]
MLTTLLLPSWTPQTQARLPLDTQKMTADVFLWHRFFIPFLLVCCFSGVGSSQEARALLDLKAALQPSSPTDVFHSWKDSDVSPCNWTGITCDSSLSVTEISLSSRNLTGVFPLDSLCRLPKLQKLDLSKNALKGGLSPWINNCSGLQYLDLSFNFLTGQVPELWNLANLRALNLSDNVFTGPFPASSLRNKTYLAWLSLGDNPFDRRSFPEEIVLLRQLRWIFLSDTNLNGEIPPAIGDLTELVNLELADNFLSGEIPVEITKLTNLWQLELYNNSFTGKFPVGFGKLSKLEYFDASTNHLEGDISELRNLTNLVSLQLFDNNLSGTIPTEFGDFKRLVNLSLYSNSFEGTLPSKLGSWAEFNFIDVSDNLLTGEIPPDMCAKGTMTRLLLLNNNFIGLIPATYANCKSMVRFRVTNNSLSGVVPAGIWGLPNVVIIDLTSNSFEGLVTSDIKSAGTLAQLFISGNKFSGSLPPEISQASSLMEIDASNNLLSGEIPSTIGQLRKLNRLKLDQNAFTGSLPDSLGSCAGLNELNLASNNLSGEIPSSLGNVRVLNALNLSMNELSGEIPASFSSLKLSVLDLSNNRLSGPIPPSLANDAYTGSFAGNPGLCSLNAGRFRPCATGSGASSNRALIICSVLATALLLLSLGFFVHLKRQRSNEGPSRDNSWDLKSFRVLTFTEHEITSAIKEENRIGKGGSGEVYRVDLDNGSTVAVKHIANLEPEENHRRSSRGTAAMLVKDKADGKWKEFEAEVAVLSSIRHLNVVKLFCSITSDDSSLLVYEYLPNGSLWEQLHGGRSKNGLDWPTRYRVAAGAAKGLEYLHHGCERPIIHRDVKSSNILLDEFFQARIADFGLAKVAKPSGGGAKDPSSAHTVAGTHGYIAPEYAYTYRINEKSDVYSFGVVLMELVTGKRPIEPEFGDGRDLVHWVSSRITTKESVMGLVDPRIPEALREDVVKVLRVAVLCTARLPNLRPTMRVVVQMLEEIGDPEPRVFLYPIKSKRKDENEEEDDENPKSQKPKSSP